MTSHAALVISVLLPALLGLLLFGSAGGDDSHITWWVVDELVRTGRIVNFNGQAVEQSSSLGLVLLMAALRSVVPISTPALGVVFSLGAASAACWLTSRVARRLDSRLSLVAAALMATSGPLVCWGTSGMETALAALASAWLLDALGGCLDALSYSLKRRTGATKLINFALACALFVSVRPENPLLLAGLVISSAGAFLLCSRTMPALREAGRKELWSVASIALLSVLLLFLVRRLEFHAWFPQPVAAKSGGAVRWSDGAQYLLDHLLEFQPLLLLLLPAAIGTVLVLAVASAKFEARHFDQRRITARI